jgi:hypothetical protein
MSEDVKTDILIGRARARTAALIRSGEALLADDVKTRGRENGVLPHGHLVVGGSMVERRTDKFPIAASPVRPRRVRRSAINFFPLQFCLHLNPEFLWHA